MSASETATTRFYPDGVPIADRAVASGDRGLMREGMVALEVASDFLTCAAGMIGIWLSAAALRCLWSPIALKELSAFGIATGLLIVLSLERDGAYRSDGHLLRVRETERALRATIRAALLLLPFNLAWSRPVPWGELLLGIGFLPLLLLLQKTALAWLMGILPPRISGVNRVAIYGARNEGRRIVSALLHARRLRLRPVAVIEEDAAGEPDALMEMGYRRNRSIPVLTGPLSSGLLRSCSCSLLIVVSPNLTGDACAAAERAAAEAGVRIAILTAPAWNGRATEKPIDLDGLSLAPLSAKRTCSAYAVGKRCFDLIASFVLLVMLAPLLVLIALLLCLDSPGPVLFVQERVGSNGTAFPMFKFRSMYESAPRYERSPANSRDPRITRMGRLLRRSSLDELPQLLNVLRGEMSLVGPRPEMPFVVQKYTAGQRRRLQVAPGLTGLWQLSADRAYPIHEALEYDLYYIRNRGFLMDLAILMHTLFFAMRGGV